MRILYHIPYPQGLGADRWIYEGWKHGLEGLGHQVRPLTAADDPARVGVEYQPSVFFTAMNLLNRRMLQTIQKMRDAGTKVLLWVHWPPVPTIDTLVTQALLREDIADLYFGEREPEGMGTFEQVTAKPYRVVPHAADPQYHFPTSPADRYAYDVVYLGAKLTKKRWFIDQVLRPLRKQYRVGVFGPGWTARDLILKVGSRAFRTVRWLGAAGVIDRARMTVPIDEENLLYSSARVCLNFHEREPDGSQPHYIVNQRTFKIPACGGLEVCDDVPAIRKYFSETEVVTVPLNVQEWVERIEYYIHHDAERREICRRAADRAQHEHLYTHRARSVLALLTGAR